MFIEILYRIKFFYFSDIGNTFVHNVDVVDDASSAADRSEICVLLFFPSLFDSLGYSLRKDNDTRAGNNLSCGYVWTYSF